MRAGGHGGTAAEALWSGSVVRKAGNDVDWNAKQHETEPPIYGKRPNKDKQGPQPPSPITGAPLPRGDALVAYENLKRERKCAGKKSGCERMSEINVVNVLCNGKMVVLCETGMGRPH